MGSTILNIDVNVKLKCVNISMDSLVWEVKAICGLV